MDTLIALGPVLFAIFITVGLCYLVWDAWTRERNLYVPKTRWNTDYYSPQADPILMKDE